MRKFFTFLLALAASVGLMNAKVTWDSSNMSSFSVSDTDQPYTLEGVTLRTNASLVMAYCDGNGDEIHFVSYETDGFTFSNTLGKNFTKIEMFLTSSGGWGNANLGSGWSFMNNGPVTWTGNASTVDLLKGEDDFGGASVKIVFYFEGDSQEPEPVLVTSNTLQLHVNDALMGSVALQNPSNDIIDNGDGTYDVPEGAEVTLIATPNEGYEFTGWKAGSVGCDFTDCGTALSTVDNPLTFDMNNEVAFMAEFAAVAPADNSVKLYHNFYGDWMETEAFGIYDDYTSEYAKISMILEPGDYQFAVKVGGELRGDGTAFSRNKQACILGEGLTANLTLNVDVKGTYRFYWFYDENRFAMDVPNVCGMYWQDVTAGNFEVTLGQEGEVTLPTVYTTNMGFASNIFNGVDQVRLVSTDETVATIEYTLSLDGLGTITIHKAGECDIYAVHDITDYYCYDSVAFHLTVLPTSTPANPSGSCGENLTWEFNTETGALTISGTGAMTSASWGTYKEDITSLSLPDGLTAIPSEAFIGCTGLTTVTIPASVTSIGADAFLGCESVTDVYCYPKAADLDWNDHFTDDFIEYPAIETRCHVFADEYLEYIARYSQGDGVNVTFMNDLEAVAVSTNEDPQNAGAVYYSTYYNSAKKYILPAGCEAYTALLSGDALTLTKIAVGGQTIPNGAAVILKSESASVTLLPTETDPVSYNEATNSLQGVDDAIAAPTNCYVLSCENNLVGFYHYTASMLNPHKAYVIYTPNSGNQAPHRLRFAFETATGVENVQGDNVQSTKVIENGVLYIIKNGVKYNAQGQVVK